MNRRSFLRGATGLAVGVGLAGCSILGSKAPPRKSKVFSDVSASQGDLTVDLRSTVKVQSRKDPNQNAVVAAGFLGGLSPIGRARAAKGATGRASGGYSSAPKRRHGWAVWHGSDNDDEWRQNHSDELQMYTADVKTMGVAYLGTEETYEDDPPGPGPVPWDKKWVDPKEGATKQYDLTEEGWYRVGVELVGKNNSLDFEWQGADLKIDQQTDGWSVEKAWHVKPRV